MKSVVCGIASNIDEGVSNIGRAGRTHNVCVCVGGGGSAGVNGREHLRVK